MRPRQQRVYSWRGRECPARPGKILRKINEIAALLKAPNKIVLKGECVKKAVPPRAGTAHLNGGQRRRSRRFIYMNGSAQGASERVQPASPIVAPRSVMNRSIRFPGPVNRGPEISQKGHIMFRKVAIALVAASVLTAPVLAQNVAPGAGKASQATTAPAPTVKADKATTKHRMVVRHHRHGTKMVKHTKHGKYAHHMKHGKPAAKQVSVKPAAKSGVN
jgi:hypothetical protein